MSFTADIELEKHRLIWSKSILSLSLLAEEVKFTISPDNLVISGVNSTNTLFSEMVFNKQFFQEYQVDFKDSISKGYDRSKQTYSFVISKSPLSLLFKNFDINSLINLKMMFNNDFKLFIVVKRNLIVKKYQLNYQPIVSDSSLNHSEQYMEKYKVQDQLSLSDSSMKYIMIDQIILKDFIDMIPLSTEEFKLELRNNRLLLNAFTKAVVKKNQYLKQPMSSTISVSIDELIESNIPQEYTQFINFKLKNLKIFINLISLVHFEKYDKNEFFEIYFKDSGDPILFHLGNNQLVEVNFLQLTNNEDSPEASSDKKSTVFSKGYKIDHVPHNSINSNSITNKSTTTTPENEKGEEIDQIPNLELEEFNEEFEATQYDEVKSIFE